MSKYCLHCGSLNHQTMDCSHQERTFVSPSEPEPILEQEPPPALVEVADGKAFEEPRWPGGPKICVAVNLPAFGTVKEAKDFNEKNGHFPILTSWKCNRCGCYHYWSGAPSSPTGDVKTGSQDLPKRITRLIEQTKI